jgi:maltose O-acetyltransferase
MSAGGGDRDIDLDGGSRWTDGYNSPGLTQEARRELLEVQLGAFGKGAIIRPPFHCDNGRNIHLGNGVFLNYNCVILDVEPVSIGAHTAIGPGVQLLTSDHPRDPALRRQQLRFGRAISIGENVWIGGGAIVLPGIAIGNDAIVGAGSIVTRDVPSGVTVVGNPARAK